MVYFVWDIVYGLWCTMCNVRVRGEACFPRNGVIRPPAAEREFLGGDRGWKSGVKIINEIQDVSGDMGGMVG